MKKISTLLSLVAVIIASSWALAHAEFFKAHDYVHAARVIEMYRSLVDGQLPVRWSENFGFGFGMPLFEFYAPLPYFVGAILHGLGLSVLTAVKLLFLFSSIFTTWGAYKLGRQFFGHAGSIVTAAAITLAPYRAVNLFVRGALSENWGIMAMPWVLLGIVKVIKGEADAWRGLTISLVVLMLSHNIMTMLFVPLSLLFAVLFAGYQKWSVRQEVGSELISLLRMSGSLLLAVGLSSFYLFPALLEKNLTQVASIFSGYFRYSQHFLYIRQFFILNWGYGGSAWGPIDGLSFFLGWEQLVGWCLVGLLFLDKLIKSRSWRKLIADQKVILAGLFLLPLVITLFMATLRSKPIWDALPVLAYAQFPWRFLGVGIIFLGLLTGMSVDLIKRIGYRHFWATFLILGLFFNAQLFRPQEFLDDAKELYYTDADTIRREMSSVLPDYIPLQMTKELLPPTKLAWCANDCAHEIEVIVDKSHENLIKTHFSTTKTVEFAVADFPGWEVEIDGQPAVKKIGTMGNIAVEVTAGEHLVGVSFGPSRVRFNSDLVSWLSLTVFTYLVFKLRQDRIHAR